MLDCVKLSYFQRHEELEVKFTEGFNVMRSANESGKSTLLRAVCYALFGSKAMPAPLSELVTWGHEERKLKVELEFTAEGVRYHVKRSKSGAELNYDGGRVTGQNEVTAFICRLLKVDSGAAPRLMLSNQNEIRGALEAGTKETTALIERLSNFDQLDDLIELLQNELTTGKETTAVDRVQDAKAALVAAEDACVEPDHASLDEAVECAAYARDAVESDIGSAEVKLELATKALNDGRVAAAERQALTDTHAAAVTRWERIDHEKGQLRAVAAPDNVDAEIEKRRQQITAEELRAEQQRRKDRIAEIDGEVEELHAVKPPVGDLGALRANLEAHRRGVEIGRKWRQVWPFTVLRGESVESFLGTMSDLEATIADHEAGVRRLEKKAAEKRAAAALLRQQVTDGSCGFCGQDFSRVPAVKDKNDRLARGANDLEVEAAAVDAEAHSAWQESDRLKSIREASQPALRALAVVGADYAALADDMLPPVLKWVGPHYSEERTDADEIEAQIAAHEARQRAYDRAQTKLEALQGERGRLAEGLPETLSAPADTRALRREIRELEAQREAYAAAQVKLQALNEEAARVIASMNEAAEALRNRPAVDLGPLGEAAEAARAALQDAKACLREAQQAYDATVATRRDAVAAYGRAVEAVAAAKKAVAEREQELKDLRFNNKLLKDVRAARPIISDKLWNMVLGAVSRYFSEMRGQESIVTKGQDGFMVDGKVVSTVSLSGSTLDILGLAIRVALVKTFLPECPFFVLDEPAQGCDDNRTANLLTFLSACGFRQVLLVTHEDTSESVAQNMITLGA